MLCGRNAVQLSPPARASRVAGSTGRKAQEPSAASRHNKYLLRLAVDDYQLTVFPDGRAIIGGTDDIATARSLYARYIGS